MFPSRREGRVFWALMLACAVVPVALGQTSSDTPPAKKPASKSTAAQHKTTKKKSSSSSASSAAKTHSTSTGKKSSRKKGARVRGQQKIDSQRAESIQTALIREHYMTGEPSGKWDARSEEAMRRYQADHGWQTKEVPDSRALIKLGLGPSKDGLLNPDSAMTTTPEAPKASPLPTTSHTAPASADPVTPGSSPASNSPNR